MVIYPQRTYKGGKKGARMEKAKGALTNQKESKLASLAYPLHYGPNSRINLVSTFKVPEIQQAVNLASALPKTAMCLVCLGFFSSFLSTQNLLLSRRPPVFPRGLHCELGALGNSNFKSCRLARSSRLAWPWRNTFGLVGNDNETSGVGGRRRARDHFLECDELIKYLCRLLRGASDPFGAHQVQKGDRGLRLQYLSSGNNCASVIMIGPSKSISTLAFSITLMRRSSQSGTRARAAKKISPCHLSRKALFGSPPPSIT